MGLGLRLGLGLGLARGSRIARACDEKNSESSLAFLQSSAPWLHALASAAALVASSSWTKIGLGLARLF